MGTRAVEGCETTGQLAHLSEPCVSSHTHPRHHQVEMEGSLWHGAALGLGKRWCADLSTEKVLSKH